MTTIKNKIAELREAEKLASKGPWEINKDFYANETSYIATADHSHHIIVRSGKNRYAEGEFICIARNSLPDILRYIERLEKVVEAAEDIVCVAYVSAEGQAQRQYLRQALAALRELEK